MRWQVESWRLSGSEGQGPSELVQRRHKTAPVERLELPPAWLTDFEGVVADQIDRLAADERLCNVLAAADFAGPGWVRFSDALARYGLQVLRAWIATGTIFARCREKGYPTQRRARILEPDVVDLANMTVAEAIAAFRDSVLPKGQWDPRRGASLRTYFIGQCLMRFPRVYARWLRENPPIQLVPDVSDEAAAGPDSDPAHVAEVRTLLEEAIGADPGRKMLIRVLALSTAGYTQNEIATRLQMSVGAVESLLYRHRRKVGA